MPAGRPSRAAIYRRLDAAVADLHARFGGLPGPGQAPELWSTMRHLESHHSTALEGNTLRLNQVETLLKQGIAIGMRPLAHYLEVQGYAAAASWVYAQALASGTWHEGSLVALHEVREVHRLVMTPVWTVASHPDATQREAPGMYREHDLRTFAGGMQAPSWPLVPAAMQDWLDAVTAAAPLLRNADASSQERMELLAELHGSFERVHPFLDGNGRVGRLLLNLMLVRTGFPPAIFVTSQRDHYLAALRHADDGDPGPLAELVAWSVADNINRFVLPAAASGNEMALLSSLADEKVSVAALRQAAQRGRLQAQRDANGVWHSSRQAVWEYQQERGSRRGGADGGKRGQ